MVAKRYAAASIFGLAALIGSCNTGFADSNKSCVRTCEDNYTKSLENCPSLNKDAEAYFSCVVKAQDKQEACDSACPSTSSSINALPGTSLPRTR
jgi:hypothetical protein